MGGSGTLALILAGTLTSLAALAHLACIVLGPRAFRFMGAGDRTVRAVEAGRIQPFVVTLLVAAVLAIWASYAFAAAGLAGPLPFDEVVLPAIAAVLTGRAVCFPLLEPVFPGNSILFWRVSSGICLVLGTLYAWGAASVWSTL
jgi:hypothetical protein